MVINLGLVHLLPKNNDYEGYSHDSVGAPVLFTWQSTFIFSCEWKEYLRVSCYLSWPNFKLEQVSNFRPLFIVVYCLPKIMSWPLGNYWLYYLINSHFDVDIDFILSKGLYYAIYSLFWFDVRADLNLDWSQVLI